MAVGDEDRRGPRRVTPRARPDVGAPTGLNASVVATERATEILRLLYGNDPQRIAKASLLLQQHPAAAAAIPALAGQGEFKDKGFDLDALAWLRGTAKLSQRQVPDAILADSARAEIYDRLGIKFKDGGMVLSPAPADRASDPRIAAGHLIDAEIERRLLEAKKPEDFGRIRDAVIKDAKDGGWLTKPADELAAGPLKAAAEHIKAQEKRYRPEARDLLAEFASPGPAARPGPAGSIKVGPDGAFSIDLGRFKSTTGTAVENTEADARSHARVSSNFLELMRASAAADPAKFKLNGEIPKMPADLRDPAAVARYNTEVAAFMKGNADALKLLRTVGVVGESGKIDFAALKAAGVDARAVAAVAAAPDALKAQAEQMLQGLGELVDHDRKTDAGALDRLGIKRAEVGAPETGDVFATSRASHDAVRRASAILAEQGVTEASLAAARKAAAEALKGGVRVATARDEAATNTAATLPALKVAQDKVAATTRAG